MYASLLKAFLLSALFLQVSFAQTKGTTFTELPDPTADTLSDWSKVKSGLNVSFVSIDKRYAKSVNPEVRNKTTEKLSGWKGERISAQILLWTKQPISEVEVKVGDFVSSSGKLSKSIASARFVRYVITDEFRNGCGHRKPEDFATSLSPDMLDDLKSFDIEAKTARPAWVSIEIPSDAKAGKYTTILTVSAKGLPSENLKIELEVLNRTLHPPSQWTFHLDQWQHPSAVARLDNVAMWSDAHFAALKPVMQLAARAGQKVITATLNKDPWNVQTYDPYADMIIWTKNTNGTWQYDYTVFDRWIQFIMDLGVKKMINCYSIIPWNNEVHYKDVQTGQFVNVKAKPGTEAFEQVWEPFLKDFVKHLKQKGWLEITNIAIDERTREEVDGALKLIQRAAPELGVSYADNQKTYQRYPNSEDISISVGHPFSKEDLADRQSRRLNTTFYICCSDGFPNQFTFSDPAESAYLGWYTEATGFDGMLRWAFNSWVEKPLHDSRFRTWPAGDTYIVYPQGRSSIRYERMLEGIQDYEKIQILKRELKPSDLTQLNNAISKLNNNTRTANWNENLNAAKRVLEEMGRK